MSVHPESEQLSDLLDGTLTEREHVSVEAHLAGCAECRALLVALRATMTDLSALPEPPVDPQVRWAIRSAVAREAKLSGRGRTFAWTAGTAAAAVIGIFAIVLAAKGGGGRSASSTAGLGSAASREAAALDSVKVLTDDLDESALSGALKSALDRTRLAYSDAATNAAGEGGGGSRFSASPQILRVNPQARGYQPAQEPGLARARECLAAIRSVRQPSTAIEVIAATFKKEPVFLFFLEVPAKKPTRIELWVTARKDCAVRYFRQSRIPPA